MVPHLAGFIGSSFSGVRMGGKAHPSRKCLKYPVVNPFVPSVTPFSGFEVVEVVPHLAGFTSNSFSGALIGGKAHPSRKCRKYPVVVNPFVPSITPFFFLLEIRSVNHTQSPGIY